MRTLLDHTMCPDDQVETCAHTSRKTSRETLFELALIFPVKLHKSSQKRIPGLSDTGITVGIRQTGVITRDASMQLHQASVSIRKSGRKTELTYPIPHVIIIQMNGKSYLAQRSPSCFSTQIESQQKRKEPVTKIYPRM